MGHRKLSSALFVVALVLGATPRVGAAPIDQLVGSKADTFYVVEAHPDDEIATWQLIDDHQDAYAVFVMMTHGERSAACVTEELSHDYPHDNPLRVPGEPGVGPYRYEGPGSPVGQPDEGERRPLVDPWVGQDTAECGVAKVASWHWFLDDVAAFDPGFPDFGIADSPTGDPWADDDLKGRFCPGPFDRHAQGHDDPSVKDKHLEPPLWDPALGCVDVWANEEGARILFDLGDGGWPPDDPRYLDPDPIDASEVISALEVVRVNRGSWGLTVLPEVGIMAAAPGCDPVGPVDKAHADHEAVQNAVYTHDFDIGPQFGGVCDGVTNHYGGVADRRFAESPGPVQEPDVAEWERLNAVDPVTKFRVGPVGVDYGWIVDGTTGHWDFPFHVMWQRFD